MRHMVDLLCDWLFTQTPSDTPVVSLSVDFCSLLHLRQAYIELLQEWLQSFVVGSFCHGPQGPHFLDAHLLVFMLLYNSLLPSIHQRIEYGQHDRMSLSNSITKHFYSSLSLARLMNPDKASCHVVRCPMEGAILQGTEVASRQQPELKPPVQQHTRNSILPTATGEIWELDHLPLES